MEPTVKAGRSELIPPSFAEHQQKLRESLNREELAKRASGPVDPALSASGLIPSESFSPIYDDWTHPFSNENPNSFVNEQRFGAGTNVAVESFLERVNAPQSVEEGGSLGRNCFTVATAAAPEAPRVATIAGEPVTAIVERILQRAMDDSNHPWLRERLVTKDSELGFRSETPLFKLDKIAVSERIQEPTREVHCTKTKNS